MLVRVLLMMWSLILVFGGAVVFILSLPSLPLHGLLFFRLFLLIFPVFLLLSFSLFSASLSRTSQPKRLGVFLTVVLVARCSLTIVYFAIPSFRVRFNGFLLWSTQNRLDEVVLKENLDIFIAVWGGLVVVELLTIAALAAIARDCEMKRDGGAGYEVPLLVDEAVERGSIGSGGQVVFPRYGTSSADPPIAVINAASAPSSRLPLLSSLPPSAPPLPAVASSSSAAADRPDLTCSICLESLRRGETTALACLHVFHKECVNDWAEKGRSKSCPVCRRDSIG